VVLTGLIWLRIATSATFGSKTCLATGGFPRVQLVAGYEGQKEEASERQVITNEETDRFCDEKR
jgi:hypothetical protein